MQKILPKPIAFEWDKGNLDKNLKTHKIDFRETEEVFLNRPLKTFSDKQHSMVEKRFQALGTTNQHRKLSIFFTIRNGRIRIISARDQNKRERRKYEAKIQEDTKI